MFFLKEKPDETIKSCTCVAGSPQRDCIPKEEAPLPTGATKLVFITSAIDAHDGRDVAFSDPPEAFLHTVTDEKVIVLLTGEICELVVKVDPTLYRKFVTTTRNRKPMLYV